MSRRLLLLAFWIAELALTPWQSIGAAARLSIEQGPVLTVHGEKGTAYSVEWSLTLENGARWQVFTNGTLNSASLRIEDLAATGSQRFYRLTDLPPAPRAPAGMVLIPAGPFQMGDTFGDSLDPVIEGPVHTVIVSAFFMDTHEVRKALWDDVHFWGVERGYDYILASARAPEHPVQTVSWHDVVKWCNARSEKEGRVPAYYTDAELTQVHRSGDSVPFVKWNSGYRLPTEAEWEKAARGGVEGRRFPWADSDTISHERANYYSNSFYSYDVSPKRGLHPSYSGGDYTSPAGSFPPNGFGLFDMAGNVWEWCWDWQDWYSAEVQTDPRGGVSGLYRVVRGGGWYREAIFCRSAYRGNATPDFRGGGTGFRTVLAAQP